MRIATLACERRVTTLGRVGALGRVATLGLWWVGRHFCRLHSIGRWQSLLDISASSWVGLWVGSLL